MSLEHRLARCITYRNEALLDPITNRLYIEDLNLSIALFEKTIRKSSLIQKGWTDEEICLVESLSRL